MKILPDGVYCNLSPEAYFAQDRLGSTDLTVLHKRPADWFYSSRHNPDRPDRVASDEMDFGSALHLLTLEGEEAFRAGTVRCAFDDFRTKEARVWRDEQRLAGKIIMTEDAERRVRHMAALILNHPEIGEALSGGLSEVSVLFTHSTGVRLRARFDKLLPRFVADLKSFGGDAKGRDTRAQCLGLVAQRDMDVQRYLYFLARQAMDGLINTGAIYGANPEQAEWLKKVASVDDWAWVWLFFRRRDDAKGHAPIVLPVVVQHFDVTFDTGRRKVETALKNYEAFTARFGFETPWAVIEPTWQPEHHDFPSWLSDVAEPVEFPAHQDKAAWPSQPSKTAPSN